MNQCYILSIANTFDIIYYMTLAFSILCILLLSNNCILTEAFDANNICAVTIDAKMIQTNGMGKKQNMMVTYT